jgi:hypothetical protein
MDEETQNLIEKAYETGLRNGKGGHNTPSPETKERLKKLEEEQKKGFNDHDLLIRLSSQMEMVLDEIKLLKDTTTNRITCLEKDKADRIELQVIQKKVNEDMETRMRDIEKTIVSKQYYEQKHNDLELQVANLKISDAVINSKASQVQVWVMGGVAIVGVLIGIIELFLRKI